MHKATRHKLYGNDLSNLRARAELAEMQMSQRWVWRAEVAVMLCKGQEFLIILATGRPSPWCVIMNNSSETYWSTNHPKGRPSVSLMLSDDNDLCSTGLRHKDEPVRVDTVQVTQFNTRYCKIWPQEQNIPLLKQLLTLFFVLFLFFTSTFLPR